MAERPNLGATEERSRQRTEVRLVKNLKDAQQFANRTGGNLTSQGDIAWKIRII